MFKTTEFYCDIDGVLLDFETSFVEYIRKLHKPNLSKDFFLTSWNMKEDFPELPITEIWKNFMNSDSFSSLNPMINPKEFNRISERCKTSLITNIPASLYHQRKKNLDQIGFQYHQLFVAGKDNYGNKEYPTKSMIIKKNSSTNQNILFLDDYPENCLEVKKEVNHSNVYLMSRPHNRSFFSKKINRISNWEKILTLFNIS